MNDTILQEQKETFLTLVDFLKRMNKLSENIGGERLSDNDIEMFKRVNEMCLDAKINLNDYENYETMTALMSTKKVAKAMQELIQNAMEIVQLMSLKAFKELDKNINTQKGEKK